MKIKLFAACALAGLLASGANAATALSENFDGQSPANPGSDLSFGAFTQFNVTSGDVDLIASGDFGISCVGGAGKCVDLSGNGPGTLTSKLSYTFGVGDLVTLSAQIRGNQRNAGPDAFTLALVNGTTVFASNSVTGLPGTTDYLTYTTTFTALSAGSVFAQIASNSGGNTGPVLDNVTLDITPGAVSAVPEPATWAMMIGGFGLAGGALRRRARATLANA